MSAARRAASLLCALLLASAPGGGARAHEPPRIPAVLETGADGATRILAMGTRGGRPAFLGPDAAALALFTARDGSALLLAHAPAGPFVAAPDDLALATLEDVDWRSSPRHGGTAHARRLYPSALRASAGPRWSFPMAKEGPARAAFDETGRYLPGSAAGGVTILHDHLGKAEAIERFGPPLGGRYRVGLGLFFHDAGSPDPRPGYGEAGDLVARLAAVRRGALLLVTAPGSALRPPGICPLGDAYEYRVTSFRAASDGEAAGGRGGLEEGPTLRDRVFASLSPDGCARAVVLRPLDHRMRYLESLPDGTLATGECAFEGPSARPVVPVDISPSAPGAPEAAHPARDGRVYLFPSPAYRAADTPQGRGVALARLDPSGTAVALRHAGPAFPDEPWRLCALPEPALDLLPDGAGSLFVLLLRTVAPERIDAALDPHAADPAAAAASLAEIATIEPGAVERDGERFRRETVIRAKRTLEIARVPLSALYSGATTLEGTTPARTFASFAPYLVGRLDAGSDLFRRVALSRDVAFADAAWLLPAQRDAAAAPPAASYRLGALVSPPPRQTGEPSAALAAMEGRRGSGETAFLPADRPLAFLAENPPAFDPDGANLRAHPWDEDGDGNAACLPVGTVEGSAVWRYLLERLDGDVPRPVAEATRVFEDRARGIAFDESSRALDLPGFGRALAARAERSLHPELFASGPLPAGRYRLTLRIACDVRDETGRRAAGPFEAVLPFETR